MKIRLQRLEMDTAYGKTNTLVSHCETARQKTGSVAGAIGDMRFSGRNDLISNLRNIENRLSRQAERMQRYGTMIAAVSDELTAADKASGRTARTLWQNAASDIARQRKTGLSLSADVSLGQIMALAGLFLSDGGDSMGVSASFYEIFKEFIKTHFTNSHTGVGYDGNRFYFSDSDDPLTGKGYDGTSRTFDGSIENGTYGADQGDMMEYKKGINVFGTQWFADQKLFDYVRSYEQYQNYTDKQIAELMIQINEEGCGYVAIVNNLFADYEGREDEFIKTFGFPMYDQNGQANYDYLLFDFYASTDNKYFLVDTNSSGDVALVNDVLDSYIGREAEFVARYGCSSGNGSVFLDMDSEAAQRILDEYKGKTEAEYEVNGASMYALDNRYQHYLDEKGISHEQEMIINQIPPSDSIRQYMHESKNVNIAVDNEFVLYDETGMKHSSENHWMTITGVTDDGWYVVSSWGKRYYLNPGDLHGQVRYYITDAKPNY